MKIVIPGGGGQLGNILARGFHAEGHEVVVITRSPVTAPWRHVHWDALGEGPWVAEIDGADVVMNLAGKSVNCRYNTQNRELIKQSRVVTTRLVGRAIAAAKHPPSIWLQANTATIYAHRFDAANDETSGIIGGEEANVPDSWRFSTDLAKAWEHEVALADVPNTRKVKLRLAMTMSPDHGGVFDAILGLVRRALGGKAGDGRQYVSWVHEADFVRAINWIIHREELNGAINLSAPNPLPNEAFMRGLREAWGTRFGIPASQWMLGVGAIFMHTETELLLKSRRVIPGVLCESGFEFQFPFWAGAAADLCQRWREGNIKWKEPRNSRLLSSFHLHENRT